MKDKFNKYYKKIYLKLQKCINKRIGRFRRRRLRTKDFSILSNNCWAGKVYQYFDLPYATPTIGMYFFADEYLRFLKNYKYYLSLPLKVVSAEQSKYAEILERKNQKRVLIGVLDDVEIILLHYQDPEQAVEKWKRRTERFNHDNVIVKFSRMNECSDEHMKEFVNLDFKKKIAFDNKRNILSDDIVYMPGYDNKPDIKDDTTYFNKYVNLVKLINRV